MKFAEPVALSVAGFIQAFTKLAHPIVWVLTASTNLVFRVFNIKPLQDEAMTAEELRHVIKTAGAQGLLDKDESEIHHNVLSFTDLRAKSLMTHRLEVEWIDASDSMEVIEKQLRASNRTLLPVCEGTYDNVWGYLHAKDFFANKAERGFQIRSIVREPVFVPENQYAIDILHQFKKSRCYFGIVTDELGAFEGVVTLHDISEALVGDLPDIDDEPSGIIRREDGTLLLNGSVTINDLNRFVQGNILPENIQFYNTIAGFIVHKMERLPDVGERFDYEGNVFEIVDKDGARIDKLLLHIGEAEEDSIIP
jgi:putative hemolysin